MAKEQRSNKWAFLFYRESAPENYLEILEGFHIPFILSPWHDRDINASKNILAVGLDRLGAGILER